MDVDLTSVEGVQIYLSPTPFAASSVVPLSGGNANFTYRIFLQEPYVTDSMPPIGSVILKHAEPYVAAIENLAFATDRQDYESLALQHVPRLSYQSLTVSVPRLYYEDRKHRVMLMSDSGVTSTTLKALFRATPPNIEVSRIIGNSLGVFLAQLHATTYIPGSTGTNIKALFDGNQQARRIVCQISYGLLVSTIAPKHPDSSLIEPPLNLNPAQLDTLDNIAKKMQGRIMTSNEVLVMGDFWTGNILVSLTPELHIDVIDWEATRPGLAGLELGQFLAEMYTLSVFHPSSLASVDTTISSFLIAYRNIILQHGPAQLNLLDIAWTAATHFGTHLITCTPRVPWGGKEQTRMVALEGLRYLFGVADGDQMWLKTTIFRDLLP